MIHDPTHLSIVRRVLAVIVLGLWDGPVIYGEESAVTAVIQSPPTATVSRIPSTPLTLADCYRLALKRSETIAIQGEVIRETEGRFLQALGTALPNVSFGLSEKRQDGSGSSAFTLSHVPQQQFTLSQPLFSGFKEFAAISGSRAEHRERLYQKTRAEQLLLVDVANAFYLLLEQREDLDALQTTRTALVERLHELNERESIGRSRRSEVVSAEAQLRRVEAQIEQAHGQDITARQLLEFLTGLSNLGPIVDPTDDIPPLDSLEHNLGFTETRPDVQATREAWRVAQRQVLVAQAKFWPTVDADANYYIKRVGVAEDIKWDATLTVNVPLFQGGQAVGAVQEASAQAREAKLTFERTHREADLDIRDAYAKLQAALISRAALKMALDAAEDSYRLQVEDYRLNLVNNLEVLQALQVLEDVRQDFVHANGEAKRLYWQLRTATGQTL